jgi:hypothetical protein
MTTHVSHSENDHRIRFTATICQECDGGEKIEQLQIAGQNTS